MKTAKKPRGKSTPRGNSGSDMQATQDQVEVAVAVEEPKEEQVAPAPVVQPAPVVAQQQHQHDDEDEGESQSSFITPRHVKPAPQNAVLSVKLTAQLHGKLVAMAQEEGVSVEALVQELLAESVTLRAWEIIERKSTMRGGNAGNQMGGNNNNRNFNHGNRHGNNNHRGGGNNNNRGNFQQGGRRQGGGPNNAWMEDKAAFLEYVRNQEKRRR